MHMYMPKPFDRYKKQHTYKKKQYTKSKQQEKCQIIGKGLDITNDSIDSYLLYHLSLHMLSLRLAI